MPLVPCSEASATRREMVVSLECHPEAATLYLTGPMRARDAMRAVRACDDIPRGVRALRADLREVHPDDAGVLETFALVLREWRAGRQVRTRIDLPRTPWLPKVGGTADPVGVG